MSQQQQLHHQHEHGMSPDLLLEALPDAYMLSASTPVCQCRLSHRQESVSSGTPSSSLLGFSDSTASFESELGATAAAVAACASPTSGAAAGQRLLDAKRLARLARLEEARLSRLLTVLDDRLAATGTTVVNKELLAGQRVAAENLLRALRLRTSAATQEAAAAAESLRRRQQRLPVGAKFCNSGDSNSGSSDDLLEL